MSYNMRYENTITNVLKVNDETTTALLRGEDPEDEESEEWFDALYNGWFVTFAIYDSTPVSEKSGMKMHEETMKSCGDYFALDTEGFNDEASDTMIVPTMFCNCNGNKTRMEAFVEKYKKGTVVDPRSRVQYRCPRCKETFKLNRHDDEKTEGD